MRKLVLLVLMLIPVSVGAQQTVWVPFCSGSNDTLAFTNIITAIGANTGTIRLPYKTASRCAVNSLTIPANVTLDNTDGTGIKVNTGQTLTVVGPRVNPVGKQLWYNVTAGLGTVSFAGNKSVGTVYPQEWGAVPDRVASTGTDSAAAIQAATVAMETATSPGILRLTGPFLWATDTTWLISKAFEIVGDHRDWTGVFFGTNLALTTDYMTYKPAAHPASEGFYIHNTTIGSAGCVSSGGTAFWQCTTAAGRHALVLDDSLTSGNLAIRYVKIENSNILANYANGIAAGNYGIYSAATNTANGGPSFSTVVDQSLIYNSLFLTNCGDSFKLTNSHVMLFNRIHVAQVSGATTFALDHNVIANRGGLSVGLAAGIAITHNIFELNEPDATGTDTAVISIQGPVYGGLIGNGNVINNQSPAPALDLIRIDSTATSLTVDVNTFFGQAAKFWLQHVNGTVRFGASTAYPTNAAAPLSTAQPQRLNLTTYSFYQMPAAGTGYLGNLSLIGDGRFIGAAGVPVVQTLDNRDATQLGAFAFNESGAVTGSIGQFGSNYTVAADRNDIKINNLTATGGLVFMTNTTSRAEFNSSGHLIWTTDNTLNIGSAGANRPAIGYFGTSVLAPVFTAATSLSIAGGTALTTTNQTGTGNLVLDTSPTFVTSLFSPLYRSTSAKVLLQGTGTGATQLAATQTTAPTCSTNCGTSPSVLGTDTAMTVTMGATGSPASGFVITFNGTWAAAPACTGVPALAGMAVGKLPIVIATTTTTITVTTNGTAPSTSDKYNFVCVGIQ